MNSLIILVMTSLAATNLTMALVKTLGVVSAFNAGGALFVTILTIGVIINDSNSKHR